MHRPVHRARHDVRMKVGKAMVRAADESYGMTITPTARKCFPWRPPQSRPKVSCPPRVRVLKPEIRVAGAPPMRWRNCRLYRRWSRGRTRQRPLPDHDPTRTDRLALYMRARAAEKVAHDEAVAAVERWSAAIAARQGSTSLARAAEQAPTHRNLLVADLLALCGAIEHLGPHLLRRRRRGKQGRAN